MACRLKLSKSIVAVGVQLFEFNKTFARLGVQIEFVTKLRGFTERAAVGQRAGDEGCVRVGRLAHQRRSVGPRHDGGPHPQRHAFARRDGEWRIVRRKYVLDWTHRFPNGLEPFRSGRMGMPILDVGESGHPEYRRL